MKQEIPLNRYGHRAVSVVLVRLDRPWNRRLHPSWRGVSAHTVPAEVTRRGVFYAVLSPCQALRDRPGASRPARLVVSPRGFALSDCSSFS